MTTMPHGTLFILCFLGIVLGLGNCRSQQETCDYALIGIQPVHDLNLTRLAEQKWYVQEIFTRRAEDVAEPDYECFMHYMQLYLGVDLTNLVEQYTPFGTGHATHNTTIARQSGTGVEQLGVFQISLDDDRQRYTAVWTHTDFQNYGVMHWCPYSDNVGGARHNYERVLTFTGTPNPDEALLSEMREMVASFGFPTEYGVQIAHHADCDYDVCEAVDERCCDPKVVNAPPMENIDLFRIHDKKWYVQEIFFLDDAIIPVAPPPPSCHVQYVTPDSAWAERMILHEIYTLANSSFNTYNGHWVLGRAVENNKAVWEVIDVYTLNKFTAVYTHTDYETYGVMHYCPYHENGEDHQAEHVVAFTGTPFPDGALLQEVREKVASFGFPTGNGARIYHHAECDYEYHG